MPGTWSEGNVEDTHLSTVVAKGNSKYALLPSGWRPGLRVRVLLLDSNDPAAGGLNGHTAADAQKVPRGRP